MSLWQIFYAVSAFFQLVDAIPTITYPINSQVPPIARVSKPFSYTFSSSTFFSNLPLSYVISNGPSWLSLDNHTRTLSGTPSLGDVGGNTVTGVTIELTAIDSSGSTTLTATLVISKDPGPVVALESAVQLSSLSAFSAPSTLLYHPSTPFKVTFDPNTFTDNSGNSGLVYYAVSADNTPLPSWILFDKTALSFSGQTPDYQSLIQPPQTFGVQLIASDVEGFAGASLFFDIEVGVHLLAFKNTQIVINATAGSDIGFNGLLGLLQLDTAPATRASIASISAELPSWLSLDNSTLALSGTVPENAASFNFTLEVVDIYGDTASALVSVEISTKIFSTSIGTLNATAGASFSYDFSTYLLNKSDVSMTAQFSPSVPWISFDSRFFILKGEVPLTTAASRIMISLVATSESLNSSESQSFDLSISPSTIKPSSTSKPSSLNPSPSSFSTGTSTAAPLSSPSQNHLSRHTLLAIFIPTIITLFAILILLCCCMRRRRAAKDKNYTDTISKMDISAPLETYSHPPSQFQTSVVEIIGINPDTIAYTKTKPPEPLKLDMSGFSAPDTKEIEGRLSLEPHDSKAKGQAQARTSDHARYTYTANPNQAMRRSQTTSATSEARKSRTQDSQILEEGRIRAVSDNALSSTEKSSMITGDRDRDSNILTLSTTSNSVTTGGRRLTRNYSNYSRKGHSRRSVLTGSANVIPAAAVGAVRDGKNIYPNAGLKLGVGDENFSHIPLNFSNYTLNPTPRTPGLGAGTAKSKLKQSLHISRPESSTNIATARRHSRFKPVLVGRTPSGIGHGRRESALSTSRKRLSIGHGQEPSRLLRDSSNWVTVDVSGVHPSDSKNRYSNASVLSEYVDIRTGVAEVAVLKTGLRKVSKSQGPELDAAGTVRSVSSDYSRHSRPVSRAIQSSPFFAGSSFRMSRHYSRRSPKKYGGRISYADSPTVPEESTRFPNQRLETTVLQGLRQGSHVKNSEEEERGRRRGRERDSFGITYGMAQEGTRQLRSFIQSQITRAGSKKSIRSLRSHKSMKSVDSRFESAAGSMAELHHRQSKAQLQQSPEIQRRRPRSELDFDDWHTDPLPEAEGSVASSWETQNGEESSENVIKYYTEMDVESSRLPLGLDRPNPGFTRQISQSVPSSPIIGEMGMLRNDSPQPRVVRGVGRRPISVDAKASKRGIRASMSQRAELDYTAYI